MALLQHSLIALHVLAAVLATWRLVDLITGDRITAGLRRRLGWYALTCDRCMSIWAGLAVTVAFVWFPWANWPLALAWLYVWRREVSTYHRLHAQVLALTATVNALTAQLTTPQATGFSFPRAPQMPGREWWRSKTTTKTPT